MKKIRRQRSSIKKLDKKKKVKKEISKKKLELNKPYLSFSFRLTAFIILFIIFFGVGIYFIVNSMNITHEESISYKEEGNVDYSVCLNDNEFFNDKCLGKDMSYVATLIKNIPINFNYKFSLSNGDLEKKMEYEIIAKLVIANKDSNSNYYEQKYVLENRTASDVKQSNNDYIINKNINIDYDYYNSIATKFKSKYGVDSDSYLDVILIAYNNASPTYNIPLFSTTSIRIPLSQKSIEIKMIPKEISENQNKVVLTNEFNISNWLYLSFGILSSIIAIILIIIIIRKLELLRSRKSEYDKKLNKILKEYDRVIVNTSTLPDFSKYCLIKIDSFEELLDVRDNLHLPIMYYNVVNHQKARFYILHENNFYLFTLKSSDIGNYKYEKKKN